MKKKILFLLLCIGLALCLSACGGEKVEAPSPAPVETATPTATPTASPEPTATPTPTPSPTVEPSPEASPEAIAEPTPTAKATPAPTPKASKAPANTPAPTPTPQATKEPEEPQLNLSENAEKNVNIPDQSTANYEDSPIPGLPVITGGPKDGSSGGGPSLIGDVITEEEFWDPALNIDTYLN